MSLPSDPPRARRRAQRLTTIAVAGLICLATTSVSAWAAFAGDASSTGNEYRAAADWVAPTASGSVIQKIQGGVPGYIRQGASYRVFAEVTDSGNPSSGISSVVATGVEAGPVTLSPGAFTAGGLDYNFRSSTRVAPSDLPEGSHPYNVASADGASNARNQTGFSVTVDNTAASAAGVQTVNATGGTLGRPEAGDKATLTYNEPIDPNSVIPGWSGAITNVVVRIDNNVFSQGGQDAMTVYNAGNSAVLPLGTVRLNRADYVSTNSTFGATGTPSTLTFAGGVATVTLGTAAGSPTTAAGTGAMSWTPGSVATDRAGNPTRTNATTETGTADKDF